jgi:rRNA maturation protein Rpf1
VLLLLLEEKGVPWRLVVINVNQSIEGVSWLSSVVININSVITVNMINNFEKLFD